MGSLFCLGVDWLEKYGWDILGIKYNRKVFFVFVFDIGRGFFCIVEEFVVDGIDLVVF